LFVSGKESGKNFRLDWVNLGIYLRTYTINDQL